MPLSIESPVPVIDTHIHFDDDRFDADRHRVYNDAIRAGVCAMVIPATTQQRWPKIQSITKQYQGVFPAFGLHPLFCDTHEKEHLLTLEQTLHQAVAVGECGLDKQRNTGNLKVQRAFFEAQIDIAKKYDLPLIIHARNTVEEITQILKRASLYRLPGNGVLHSFNGSVEQAHRLIDLNFKLSFGGPLTRSNASKLRKLVSKLPLDSIMVETDAPDQTGAMHRGRRNEPQWITEVISAIATIRTESETKIAAISNSNARTLFQLPDHECMKARTC